MNCCQRAWRCLLTCNRETFRGCHNLNDEHHESGVTPIYLVLQASPVFPAAATVPVYYAKMRLGQLQERRWASLSHTADWTWLRHRPILASMSRHLSRVAVTSVKVLLCHMWNHIPEPSPSVFVLTTWIIIGIHDQDWHNKELRNLSTWPNRSSSLLGMLSRGPQLSLTVTANKLMPLSPFDSFEDSIFLPSSC